MREWMGNNNQQAVELLWESCNLMGMDAVSVDGVCVVGDENWWKTVL